VVFVQGEYASSLYSEVEGAMNVSIVDVNTLAELNQLPCGALVIDVKDILDQSELLIIALLFESGYYPIVARRFLHELEKSWVVETAELDSQYCIITNFTSLNKDNLAENAPFWRHKKEKELEV